MLGAHLAREVGIRQPSLYAHFGSKHALYDAMFADGNRQLLAHLDDVALPEGPRAAVKRILRAFVEFALADSSRCSLLFQRPIPGFEPSAQSYSLAEAVMRRVLAVLRTAGVEDQADVDCIVAMVAGLIDAQISNDPDGDRWTRHLERLTDLYLDEATQRSTTDDATTDCSTGSTDPRRRGVPPLRRSGGVVHDRGLDPTD